MITVKKHSDFGHLALFFLSQTTKKFDLQEEVPIPRLYYHIAARCAEYFPTVAGNVDSYFTPLKGPPIKKSDLSTITCRLPRPQKAKSITGCYPTINRAILAAQCLTDHGYLRYDIPPSLTKNYVDKICKNPYNASMDQDFVYFIPPLVLVPFVEEVEPIKQEVPWY